MTQEAVRGVFVPEEMREEALSELQGIEVRSAEEKASPGFKLASNLHIVNSINRLGAVREVLFRHPAEILSVPDAFKLYVTNINLSLVDVKHHNWRSVFHPPYVRATYDYLYDDYQGSLHRFAAQEFVKLSEEQILEKVKKSISSAA